MICDVHAHYMPKAFSEFMGDRFARPRICRSSAAWRGIRSRIRRRTSRAGSELMDDAGVEKQVLSPNHPPYLPDEAECVQAVQYAERRLCRAGAAATRGGSRPTSCCRCRISTRRCSEMERGFDQLGCVGVNMNISCLGRSIAETEFEPIYAEMNRRGAVLFVHPSVTGDLLAVDQRLQVPRVGRQLAGGRDVRRCT